MRMNGSKIDVPGRSSSPLGPLVQPIDDGIKVGILAVAKAAG